MSRATVADFNMYWKPSSTTLPYVDQFITRFLGDTKPSDWQIWHANDKEHHHTYLRAALCASKGCVIVTTALFTDKEGNRETEMRLWQAIIDCFSLSGLELTKLRFVAFRWVINADVREAMALEFNTHAPDELQVTVSEQDAVAWRGNPFIRCALRVGEGIASGRSADMRVHMNRDEISEDPEFSHLMSLNMLAEFREQRKLA